MVPALPLRLRAGRRIRALRLLKTWSQEKLGEKAGLSYKFVGEIERGVANPTIDTLEALGRALDVDVIELLGPSGGPASIDEYVLTHDEASVAREALSSLEDIVQRFSVPTRRGQERPYRRPGRSSKRR